MDVYLRSMDHADAYLLDNDARITDVDAIMDVVRRWSVYGTDGGDPVMGEADVTGQFLFAGEGTGFEIIFGPGVGEPDSA